MCVCVCVYKIYICIKYASVCVYIYIRYTYVLNMQVCVCVCVCVCMLAMWWDFSSPSHDSLAFLFSLLHFCFKYFTLTNNVYSWKSIIVGVKGDVEDTGNYSDAHGRVI